MIRRTARALLSGPYDRVLLVRVHDPIAADADDPVTDYWMTIGGGVEAGESLEAALVREAFEETGHRITDPGPCIWRRFKSVTGTDGTTRTADEHYYWCQLPTAKLDSTSLTRHPPFGEAERHHRSCGVDPTGDQGEAASEAYNIGLTTEHLTQALVEQP